MIRLSRALRSKHAALVQIGYRKRSLQMRTRIGFKCGQIQAAAGAAVEVENRRAVRPSTFDADMEANAVDGFHKVGFKKTHAALMKS